MTVSHCVRSSTFSRVEQSEFLVLAGSSEIGSSPVKVHILNNVRLFLHLCAALHGLHVPQLHFVRSGTKNIVRGRMEENLSCFSAVTHLIARDRFQVAYIVTFACVCHVEYGIVYAGNGDPAILAG